MFCLPIIDWLATHDLIVNEQTDKVMELAREHFPHLAIKHIITLINYLIQLIT